MAKSKTESEPLPLDKQVEELKAKLESAEAAVRTLTLEKSQAEGELARIKADPFLSREGHTEFIKDVYKMMWCATRMLKPSGTKKEVDAGLLVLRNYLGDATVEGMESKWRG